MTKLARLFDNADDVLDAWRDALKQRDVQGALDIWLDDDSITIQLKQYISDQIKLKLIFFSTLP